MKRFLLLAPALVGCVTSPRDSTPTLRVGLYHDIVATDLKMEIKPDRSFDYFQLQPDNSKRPLGNGSVSFSGDTVKISLCYKCDTGSYFVRSDTLLVVKFGVHTVPIDPPQPWFAKE